MVSIASSFLCCDKVEDLPFCEFKVGSTVISDSEFQLHLMYKFVSELPNKLLDKELASLNIIDVLHHYGVDVGLLTFVCFYGNIQAPNNFMTISKAHFNLSQLQLHAWTSLTISCRDT